MSRRFLVGVDESPDTLDAVHRFGSILQQSDVHFHLFHAVPESSLIYPGELSTITGESSDWEKVQRRQAQKVLDNAVALLVEQGHKRSRLHLKSKLKSVNVAQDILEACEAADYTAIVMARKGHSAVKRFILGSTASMVCQYSDKLPVWVIGTPSLQPLQVLVALDESDYASRVVSHLAGNIAQVPGARFTLLHVMPAKPPVYWDDGHILDETERRERQETVAKWRSQYEERMTRSFATAREVLTKAGVDRERISTRIQPMLRGVARDILAEVARGGYNVLAFGRRGASGISEFNLGSRAAKLLQSTPECTLIVVN